MSCKKPTKARDVLKSSIWRLIIDPLNFRNLLLFWSQPKNSASKHRRIYVTINANSPSFNSVTLGSTTSDYHSLILKVTNARCRSEFYVSFPVIGAPISLLYTPLSHTSSANSPYYFPNIRLHLLRPNLLITRKLLRHLNQFRRNTILRHIFRD
jgi:hypothetical protein